MKPRITSHFLWIFLYLISLTDLIQSGKGPLILAHFSSMCILVFLFHKLSLDTMICICKADSPLWWERYLVQFGVVLLPSQLKQKVSSSCGTLQDAGTSRAKLFVENLFLLFMAERSSACSEIAPINLNMQYKVLIYV